MVDPTPVTYALCSSLDPTAPLLRDERVPQNSGTHLASYQWLKIAAAPPDVGPQSLWLSAGDDPAMVGGVDYLAFFVIDLADEGPSAAAGSAPEFLPHWKSRTGAGRWLNPSPPPYTLEKPTEPLETRIDSPPGLTSGEYWTWFFGPIKLDRQSYEITFSFTGAAVVHGGESYYLDPEMEIGPP